MANDVALPTGFELDQAPVLGLPAGFALDQPHGFPFGNVGLPAALDLSGSPGGGNRADPRTRYWSPPDVDRVSAGADWIDMMRAMAWDPPNLPLFRGGPPAWSSSQRPPYPPSLGAGDRATPATPVSFFPTRGDINRLRGEASASDQGTDGNEQPPFGPPQIQNVADYPAYAPPHEDIPGGPWTWSPNPQNKRFGGAYAGPKSGSFASWDDDLGHWDVDDRAGHRQRYNR